EREPAAHGSPAPCPLRSRATPQGSSCALHGTHRPGLELRAAACGQHRAALHHQLVGLGRNTAASLGAFPGAVLMDQPGATATQQHGGLTCGRSGGGPVFGGPIAGGSLGGGPLSGGHVLDGAACARSGGGGGGDDAAALTRAAALVA